MSYVARDPKGHITAIYSSPTGGTTEQLSLTHPEVREFLSQCDSPDSLDTALRESDLGMGRVTPARRRAAMLYVISCTDKPDHGAVRQENRPAHLDYLKAKGATLRLAGPYTADDGEAVLGSLTARGAMRGRLSELSGLIDDDTGI